MSSRFLIGVLSSSSMYALVFLSKFHWSSACENISSCGSRDYHADLILMEVQACKGHYINS